MKLLIIDGNSIINRAFYGVRAALTNSEGRPTNAVYGFLNIYLKTVAQYKPDCIACAFDRKEPTFRHKMYDGYKATRKGMPEELSVQMPLLKDLLSVMNVVCLEKAGYEADDIIGTVARMCSESGNECIILTGDRDDFQLTGKGVSVAFTVTKEHETVTELLGEKEIFERLGVTPDKLIDVKALMGDSSDNVPGVAGIGEKSAYELIIKYGSLENLYENIEQEKGSRKDKLSAGRDMAFLSRKLVTIDRNVPLEKSVEDMIYHEPSREQFIAKLQWLGFNSVIKKLHLDEKAEEIKESVAASANINEISASEFAGKLCGKIISIMTDGEKLFAEKDGEVYFTKADEGMTAVREIMENESVKKQTFGLKALYRLAMKNGIKIKCADFDIETAIYLLDPSASGYTLAGAVSSMLGESYNTDAESLVRLNELRAETEKRLAEKQMTELYNTVELPLTEVLASMEHIGFAADASALSAFGESLSKQIDELSDKIYEIAGTKFNINSPKQLGDILFDKLMLPCKGKKRSTDAATLEKLLPFNPIIELILEYRSCAKLKSTYADGLLKEIASDGRIHSTFLQTVTQTGRISSKEPNLQNIPVRKEQGRELRKMLVASDGMTLCDGDYSQIELRVLADISGDEAMTDAFVHGEDIHTRTASQVFDVHPDFVTPIQRSQAKTVNFGIVYGIGEFSLSNDLKISVGEARRYIKSYFDTYSGVREYMTATVEKAKKDGCVRTAFGRIRNIPELTAANKNVVAFGERVARNTPIQGTAADIIKIAMIKVYRRLEKENIGARLILQIHDELIVECPEKEREKVLSIMKEEMETAVKLSVPLVADVSSGKSWYEAK